MGFLDNLESNLENLESVSEREDPRGAKDRRDADRAARVALQPSIEKLRKSRFTDHLLRAAHQESFRIRARIAVVWVGDILRLDLPGKRLELQPSATGVMSVASVNGVPTKRLPVDFDGDPSVLLKDWLGQTAA